MLIRNYNTYDCVELSKLFYDTVYAINSKDYPKPQLDSWTGSINLDNWNKSFLQNKTLVAEYNHIIVGFADMDKKGYLDHLYVHKDYQNKGIGSALLSSLEKNAKTNNIDFFTTNSSITAKSFFEKQGYLTISEQIVKRGSSTIKNFVMQKTINKSPIPNDLIII